MLDRPLGVTDGYTAGRMSKCWYVGFKCNGEGNLIWGNPYFGAFFGSSRKGRKEL